MKEKERKGKRDGGREGAHVRRECGRGRRERERERKSDLSDGLGCFDEFRVVLVDQVLHITVKLLNLCRPVIHVHVLL